jgi:hypothetical protein
MFITEFVLVDINERDNSGESDEYDKMDEIVKLILLKWLGGISFTDLLLGFCVDCNETHKPIKTSSEYHLFEKCPVTCS